MEGMEGSHLTVSSGRCPEVSPDHLDIAALINAPYQPSSMLHYSPDHFFSLTIVINEAENKRKQAAKAMSSSLGPIVQLT
eukprot:1158585-Pelagomonas_calceolata.AAC.1